MSVDLDTTCFETPAWTEEEIDTAIARFKLWGEKTPFGFRSTTPEFFVGEGAGEVTIDKEYCTEDGEVLDQPSGSPKYYRYLGDDKHEEFSGKVVEGFLVKTSARVVGRNAIIGLSNAISTMQMIYEMNCQQKSSAILAIHNRHSDDCGAPPQILEEAGDYTCYFTNHHREQAIIQYNSETRLCRFWSGDIGWEELKVEKFRDRWIVLLPNKLKPQSDAITKGIRIAMRKLFGKPTLTDDECDYVANSPILSQGEFQIINAFLNEVCE